MEKLFAKIKREILDPDEKAKIFSVLRNFMIKNPIQSVRSPFYSEWLVWRYKATLAPIAIVLVFVLTGGSVFASKNSLPGDTLYPVKMLKEKVESLTATDTKARAEIEVTHAISRLQEVEQIVSSKKQFEKGTGQEISNNFGTQAKDAANNIDELKNSGQAEEAAKIQSNFNKSLSEHEKKIQNIITNTNTQTQTKEELSRVYSDVHSQMEKNSKKFQHKND
jgi:hypothetical protein